MELDELKKSWNALNEHLKDKEFIKEEEIKRLLGRTRNNFYSMERFNRKLRFIAVGILILSMFFWVCDDSLTDIHYYIALLLCIPAFGWDIYSAHYLSQTRIDEMPLVTIVARINRYHRWMVYEWIIGILYLLVMVTFFSFYKQVWLYSATELFSFLIIWTVGLGICFWVYRCNLRHIKEIKKNLNELKELNQTA